MLSENTISIVKSTAPILQEHGETLTKHFYQRMFSHNPEVGPYFNAANQTKGTQQRALAGAICAYAANIDNLEVLGDAVELISNKHVSLMIKPEHYPIVDDVINAWAEAYGFLTDILIGREKQLYSDSATKDGGWEGFRKFKVDRKDKESSNIASFYLKPEDGGPLPEFLPGQYITIRVPTLNGSTTMRNYSLSNKPGRDYFRISVKRELALVDGAPDGYVSNMLHDNIEQGDTLEIGPPCGEFFLNVKDRHERPLVLLAAGIGITPIMSILKTTLEAMPDRKVILIHGCLTDEVQPFKSVIDEFSASHPNLDVHYRYSDLGPDADLADENCSTGFVDAELIESMVPDRHADYYFCGPRPFMINIYQDLLLWGIPSSQVHFEFFGPREELEKAA